MKIFWSWQSDTPGKIGRYLIRDALKGAVDQIKQTPDIEEPAREDLHLDHDIQGVTGSPDLVRTIFDKIDQSAIVVADVTLVGNVNTSGADGATAAGKKLINSNVAIELGYALRALTDRNVLLVFNEHYGKHEDLPFDLRHKGGSIVFNLAPDADKRLIEDQKKKLRDWFVSSLKPYVQKSQVSPGPFPETSPTFSKAAYFQKGEILARAGTRGFDEITFSYDIESLCYLRLIPISPLACPLSLATLKDVAQHAPTLSGHGVVLCRPQRARRHRIPARVEPTSWPSRARRLYSVVSEWGDLEHRRGTDQNRTSRGTNRYNVSVSSPCPFERLYYDNLRSITGFATKDLGLKPPWNVEFGLVGIKGLYLPVEVRRTLEWWGPISKPEIVHRAILKEEDSTGLDRLLLDFFNLVYDATGNARPVGYCGFPPNRPRQNYRG